MKIRWSPLAIKRVGEIAGYIAQNDPLAADQWARSVFDRVKQVGAFSKSGRYVPEIMRTDIREIVFGNYRIVYRVETKAVSILTVRHYKQILPRADIRNAWK